MAKLKQQLPPISKSTIDVYLDNLELKFPNKLPLKELTAFEQGKLVGHQEVITHIYAFKETLK